MTPSTLAASHALRRAHAALTRRRALSEALRRLGAVALPAGFAAGAATLALRSFAPHAPAWWPLPLAALACAAYAARHAWLARPSATLSATWLDVHGGAGGEVLTEAELGASAWSPLAHARLERALGALPKLDGAALARRAAPALAFALAALWIPLPSRVSPSALPRVGARALERVAERLEELVDTLALTPELEEQLEEQLAAAEEASDQGRFDASFEALDRLEQALEQEAERALEAAEQAAGELAAAQSDPHLEHAQQALETAFDALRDAGLTAGLSPQTLDAMDAALELPEGAALSSRELSELARELSRTSQEALARLASSRLVDAARLAEMAARAAQSTGELGEAGEFDPDHECDESCKQPGGT